MGSLDINVSFSHGLPVFDHGAHFVMGKIHGLEVRQAGLPCTSSVNRLNFLMQLFHSADQLGSLQKKKKTLETIGCNFGSLSSCDECFWNISYIEHSCCFHIIPIFLRK